MSYNPPPNIAYSAEPSNHSYRRGGMGFNAGDSDNMYAANAVQSHGPTPISCDEEIPVEGMIEKQSLVDMVKKLQKQAIDDDMLYAAHMLGLVTEFVKST
jgi:hypothetical protein